MLPSYLEANYAKRKPLKLLLSRNEPIALKNCYFFTRDFKTRGDRISSEEFLEQVNQSAGKVVITALAGTSGMPLPYYSDRLFILIEITLSIYKLH